MFHLLYTVLLLAVAPASASAPESTALSLGGVVQFTPPPVPWICIRLEQAGKVATYRLDRERDDAPPDTLIIAAVPARAPRIEAQRQLGPGVILDRIKIEFRKNKTEMLVEPELQQDERFFVKIYEKYRRGDNMVSQWHLYRNIPPHQIAVTIISTSQDESESEQTRLLGESIALSGQVVPRGKKPPPAPTVARSPTTRPTTGSGRPDTPTSRAPPK